MERWLTEHLEPIVFATLAAWFAVTKWLLGKLYQKQEARMLAIETRLDHHEEDDDKARDRLEGKITRVEDKIDAHNRVIDAKIDSILHHLMARQPNQREADKQ